MYTCAVKQGTRRRELMMMLASTWLLVVFAAFVAIRQTTQLVERWSHPQVQIFLGGGAIHKVTQPHPTTTFIAVTVALDVAFLLLLWLALSVTVRVRRGDT